MSERHRALPTWMSKEQEKAKVKEPLKSKRKPKVARSIFYCMNEKELVGAAFSYLTNCARNDLPTDQKTEPQTAELTVEVKGNPGTKQRTLNPVAEASVEESLDSGDAQDMSCVSETDLDITEVETLPYPVSSKDDKAGEEERDHNDEIQNGNKDGESEIHAKAAEEDDAFRLVREIFFT